MQKVITINLNGNAFQLDEAAYEALRGYLDNAETQLETNPDRTEVLADLEQAIGDKCLRFLAPHKTVVSTAEVDQILGEMGPVDGGQSTDDAKQTAARARANSRAAAGAVKRLYKIQEGAMVGGVCNGLAAYFDLDPTIVRIGFVFASLMELAITDDPPWMVALTYIILMFVVPFANTSEERAAAQGLPFNAQELIDNAKKNYAHFRDKHWKGTLWSWHWKPKWPVGSTDPRRLTMSSVPDHADYGAQLLSGVFVPLFSIFSAGLFVALVITIISLTQSGRILRAPLPEHFPLWGVVVILVSLYLFVAAALRLMRQMAYDGYSRARRVSLEVWGGVVWVGAAIVFFLIAYSNLPELRDALQVLPFWRRIP